jgi:hypothetical protein
VTARRAAPGAGRRVRPVTGWRWWARANGCGARGSTAHSTWGCSHLLPLDAQGAASGAWRINADDELGTDREVPAGPRGRVQVAASRCCGDAPCCDQENHGLCDGLSTACEMCATCHCVPTGLPGCAPERPCHTSGGGSRHGDRRRQCLGARGNPSPYGLDRTVPSAARAKAARLLVQRLARRATGIAGQACLEMRPFTAFETAGMRTVCGRTDLKNYIPDQAAEAVRGLRSAGAVIMGRSNMPAGHQDVQADNPVFGPSSHPWDTARTSGGSAGGGRPTSPACTGTSRQGDRSPSSDMFPTARGRDGGQRPTWPAAAHRSATHVTSSRSCRRWSGRRTTTSASPAHCASARDRTR